MSRTTRFFLPLLVCLIARTAPADSPASETAAYTPSPENLAARSAFQDDKFGVFIHWGVYSVLGRGEWVMHREKMTVEQYEPLAERFNPVKYDPDAWCRLFKQAGATYVTITSKHHDGFAMWDSRVTDWDIVDRTPYGKDALKPLADACERHGLKLFFYHSQLDWRHADYFPRGRTGKESGRPDEGDFAKYIDFMNSQLAELLSGDYGQVAGIWFDGWWDQKIKRTPKTAGEPSYASRVDWRLRETYDLIHRLQPQCLVGANHHVAPFPGEDFQMFEKDLPGENKTGFSEDAVIGALPLETCDTINGAWGYNAKDHSYKSTKQLIHYLVNAAGRDANFLLNVGPKPDGTIQPEFEERLTAIGEWLDEHGESVYGTRGGPIPPQAWGVTTHKGNTAYLHLLEPTPDDEAWAKLTGTKEVDLSPPKLFGGGEVQSKRDDEGTLWVKLDGAKEQVDSILVAELKE